MARKKFLINKPFQLRFLLFLFLICVVVTSAYLISSLQFFTRFEELAVASGIPQHHSMYDFLALQRRTLLALFAISSVFSAIFIATFGLLFSHRIAGPLYRLHQHMLRVGRGEPVDEVAFREGDFFPELAEAYNKQIQKTKSNLS